MMLPTYALVAIVRLAFALIATLFFTQLVGEDYSPIYGLLYMVYCLYEVYGVAKIRYGDEQ